LGLTDVFLSLLSRMLSMQRITVHPSWLANLQLRNYIRKRAKKKLKLLNIQEKLRETGRSGIASGYRKMLQIAAGIASRKADFGRTTGPFGHSQGGKSTKP
jgi:hypothetical protein